MARADISQMSVLHSKHWSGKQNRRRENTSRKKKRHTNHEINSIVQKKVKKALKQEKKERNEELYAFEKMSASDSDKESIWSRSSEECEI